jgi:hypothetical protein
MGGSCREDRRAIIDEVKEADGSWPGGQLDLETMKSRIYL